MELLWFLIEKLNHVVFTGLSCSHQLSSMKEISADIKTSGNLRVLCLGYTVDASKLRSQALFIFGESSKICVIERYGGGRAIAVHNELFPSYPTIHTA